MNELTLFTGAGGGCLASKWLLGHRIVGYVEIDDYCQKVIKARIEDGLLDAAPIWPDARAFDGSGLRGSVDVVSAGFPCPPFSVAGKRKGEADERNLWPETIRIIREVGPRFAFVENVPGLLADPYFGTILGELAESGYDAEWICLSASTCGAPHQRERLWVLAYTRHEGRSTIEREDPSAEHPGVCEVAADVDGKRLDGKGLHLRWRGSQQAKTEPDRNRPIAATYTDPAGLSKRQEDERGESEEKPINARNTTARGTWWDSEPDLVRLVHGFPDRVVRIRALGNAQVPLVAAAAFRILMARISGGSPRVATDPGLRPDVPPRGPASNTGELGASTRGPVRRKHRTYVDSGEESRNSPESSGLSSGSTPVCGSVGAGHPGEGRSGGPQEAPAEQEGSPMAPRNKAAAKGTKKSGGRKSKVVTATQDTKAVAKKKLAQLKNVALAAAEKLEEATTTHDKTVEDAKSKLTAEKGKYATAIAPYRDACRKAKVECEFGGARAHDVSEQVRFDVQKVKGGIEVTVKGKPRTKTLITTKDLKESVNKAAYRYTDKHIGPKSVVGNKGGSLSNRLRSAIAG